MSNSSVKNPELHASVVIPTKNGGPLFEKVLATVLAQRIDAGKGFEVLVLDSCSTDGTAEHVKQLLQSCSNLQLHNIPLGEFGHGRTRNLGVSLARGEIVAFLTQDALPANTNWLKELCDTLAAEPNAAGAFGKHIPYPDCDPFERASLQAHFASFGKERTYFGLDDPERYKTDDAYRHKLCFYSDNNSAMKKSYWEQLPYPDVNFAEDQFWARAVIERGWKKAYAPDATVYHSHRYKYSEMVPRYFEEFKSLALVYNYRPVRGIRSLISSILRHVLMDFGAIRSSSGFSLASKMRWMAYSLIKNSLRYLAALKAHRSISSQTGEPT